CSGPCLTVVAVEDGAFSVEASAETLACSTLGEWGEGTPVNLERALRLGDELGGHLVSGHVDGVARLVERRPEGDSVRFVIVAPYYAHLSALLRNGAERAVAAAGATCETVTVPGAFEIPGAIALAAGSGGQFDGFVGLGCVIRGETTHYDHVCAESARGMQEL